MRSAVACVAAALVAVLAGRAEAAVRYVNVALAGGADNGTSWDNAYRTVDGVSRALAASVSGDEIWVAAGTYKPTAGTSRTVFITLKTGVAVYGGFAGMETEVSQRSVSGNVTVLTGDLLGNDNGTTTNLADNSYHVVVGSSVATSAVLDGFTIRGGYANGATGSNYDKGGGILVLTNGNPTVRQCRFIGNRCTFGGGAGYIFGANGSFVDCEFTDNIGGSYGGAFDTNGTTVRWERCLFRNNQASRAGAIESYGSSQSTIINCVFVLNRATTSNSGGAVWAGTSSVVTVRNSTFVGNSAAATSGGGFYNTSGTSTLANCIFWANTGNSGATTNNQVTEAGGTNTVSYSLVQGGIAGTGNISAAPTFVDQAASNVRLQANSAGIDAGSNSLIPAGVTVDHDGNARRVDIVAVTDSGVGGAPVVDMGAFEVQPPPPPACPADLDNDGAVGGSDLASILSAWATADADVNGDGITDGADLTEALSAWGPCP
ncbi:MAG: hypothetical protein EBR10_08725 [Planctomycetes bacterium]|nr:hypothetical protein [Planctomycetota bacterium]